jgi:hypothetical protein
MSAQSSLKPRRAVLDPLQTKRGLPFWALTLILLGCAALVVAAWLLAPWIAEDDTAAPIGVQLINGYGMRDFAPMWLIPFGVFLLVYASLPRAFYPYLQLLSIPFRLLPALLGIGSINVVRLAPFPPAPEALFRLHRCAYPSCHCRVSQHSASLAPCALHSAADLHQSGSQCSAGHAAQPALLLAVSRANAAEPA